MDNSFESIGNRLVKSLTTQDTKYIEPVQTCVRIFAEAIREKKRIFTCGNGGSASTASHIANDLMCHMRNWNREGYRVLSLTDNMSAVTSMTNDYGFDFIFARQLEVFGESGDVLWTFSTSGNSKNCVEAVKAAKQMGIQSVALTGRGGGTLKDLCDVWVPVDSDEVTRVEELHMIYAHIIGENVEAILSPMDENSAV